MLAQIVGSEKDWVIMPDSKAFFAEWLKNQMAQQGLNQNQLALKIGVDPVAVGHWLKARNSIQKKHLQALANALEVDIEAVTLAASGYTSDPDEIKYMVDMDELRVEGYNDYDDLTPEEWAIVRSVW